MVTSSLGSGGGDRKNGAASVGDVRLGVERIRLFARHGVYEEERRRGNQFEIDVHVTGDWAVAAQSDRLEDTLDYDAIVRHIHGVSQRRSYHLIESFAGAIADDVLRAFPGVSEVRVCVRKLGFRTWGPEACATAAVTKRRAPSGA